MERDEKLASASEDARQIAGKYEANAYGFANLSIVIENVYVKNQNVATIYRNLAKNYAENNLEIFFYLILLFNFYKNLSIIISDLKFIVLQM